MYILIAHIFVLAVITTESTKNTTEKDVADWGGKWLAGAKQRMEREKYVII